MRILVFTHMYPTEQNPASGIFIQQQVESLRAIGIEVDVLHVDTKDSKWNYPWSIVPLLRRVYTNSYNLVHAHYVFAAVIARSQFRFPLVITHHGDEAFHGWQAPLCWLLSRFVDKTIVVSEQIKHVIGLESVAVIPCGVDFDLFAPVPQCEARHRLGLPLDKRLVLFVGAIEKQLKRIDLARDAVARLKSQNMDVELIEVHDEPYNRIPLYMNACDVLILPSEREGSPQVVKEAMACNLPVVATAVGDVPDVLAGVEGCCICQRDPADIAWKLENVLNNRQRTCGRNAVRSYEIGTIAKMIVQTYEGVLSKRCGHG